METGERIGPYLLKGKLNAGGMAEIYRAVREGVMGVSREVCIKRIRRELGGVQFVEMFIDEARISSQLRHANIVSVEDFGEADGALFLVMEWIHGIDAAELLRRAAPTGGGLPVDVAVHLLGCLLRALAYAHAKRDAEGRWLQIVHRDVSPHNLLVSYEGDVKLSDFGIAKASSRMHQTAGVQLKGKFGYMSPEQAMGEEVDLRTDLWAAGVVAYQLLTGRLPHSAGSANELLPAIVAGRRVRLDVALPELPAPLVAIVERLLAAKAADRYQSAGEALEALDALPERASGLKALRALVRRVAPAEGFSTVGEKPALDPDALASAPTMVTPMAREALAAAPTRAVAGPYPAASAQRATAAARPLPAAQGSTTVPSPPPVADVVAEPPPVARTLTAEVTPMGVEVVSEARAVASLRPRPPRTVSLRVALAGGLALVLLSAAGAGELALRATADGLRPGAPSPRNPEADLPARPMPLPSGAKAYVVVTAPDLREVVIDGRRHPIADWMSDRSKIEVTPGRHSIQGYSRSGGRMVGPEMRLLPGEIGHAFLVREVFVRPKARMVVLAPRTAQVTLDGRQELFRRSFDLSPGNHIIFAIQEGQPVFGPYQFSSSPAELVTIRFGPDGGVHHQPPTCPLPEGFSEDTPSPTDEAR